MSKSLAAIAAAVEAVPTAPSIVQRDPRLIDRWRPVHDWPVGKAWALIERFGGNPHPAYQLGWSRVSCAAYIFGSSNQWTSLRAVNPRRFRTLVGYGREFGKTIDRHLTIARMADAGQSFAGMPTALSSTFDEPDIGDPGTLPRGAHGDACGPT